jgi:hypothetical protein
MFCPMFYKNIEKLRSTHFKRLTGVKRAVFEQILKSLNEAKAKSRKHSRRGTPAKLCNADKLLLLIMYYREYRTQFHIGITYGISESRFCEIIRETESVLIQDPRFHLPWKKVLLKEENRFEVVLIDVTESPVERPEKKERLSYSGKKKRHTRKTQVVAAVTSRKILCTDFAKGHVHDFKLFKNSLVYLKEDTTCLVDTSYPGIRKLHGNSEQPNNLSFVYSIQANHPKRRQYDIVPAA